MDPLVSGWHKVADSEAALDFKSNDITEVTVAGKSYCIGRWQGNLYGFAQTCPHGGALLAEGYRDSLGNLVCPLHHYKFNIRTGRNSSGEGYYLRHWPVEKRPDGVYFGL